MRFPRNAYDPNVSGRRATDHEVSTWREHGWVLLDGLVGDDDIDAGLHDFHNYFPTAAKYHADPERHIPAGKTRAELRRGYPELPETGPAFRPEQHRWGHEFPFHGDGNLNRLFVHSSIVDFVERALGTTDIRLYQGSVNAKYAGAANYEQPMHTDRNHSFLPPVGASPWWHIETFLYLTDVGDDLMPTHVVSRRDSEDYTVNDIYMPDTAPELYAAERAAAGPRGSLLAYRPDVFHRAVDMTRPDGARFLLNVSFKVANQDWIGYHSMQSRANHPAWVQFVERSTPRELELFGFPPPGHEIWTDEMLRATQVRYPHLDLDPWRDA